MLTSCQTTECYLNNLNFAIAKIPLEILDEFQSDIQLFKIIDLDPAVPLLLTRYSKTGRPGIDPIKLFRSHLFESRHKLNHKEFRKILHRSSMVRALCGFESIDEIPSVGTLYNFDERLVPTKEKLVIRAPYGKKTKKLKQGEKLPEKKGVKRTTRIAKAILEGRIDLSNSPERLMQIIFAEVVVKPSIKIGLIDPNITLSGDGTCLETGASSYGRKICDCKSKGIWSCKCERRYSDPLATPGWDSHKNRWFYGYTAFILNTFSKKHHKDLPLYVRLFEARRHDSISSMIALQEFQEIYPDLRIKHFLGDSAMDVNPIYTLLNRWDISAVIDLNGHRGRKPKVGDIRFDQSGQPICPGELPMTYYGSWKRGYTTRVKYRCPDKTGDYACPLAEYCSEKPYGRVYTISIHTEEDLRFYTKIPRNSKKWYRLYKERSSVERTNKQLLIDHGIENSMIRSKRRNFIQCIFACIDIHLKAQYEILNK